MENISKKEFWIGTALAILALAVAIYFEPFIKDRMLQEVRTYQNALQVQNDPKLFQYAQKTDVGNVLALGNLEALQPQSIPELQGSYAIIVRSKEHYTRHTREDCSTDAKGNTTCETVVYYDWDTVETRKWQSDSYGFLGVTFPKITLNLPGAQRLALTTDVMADNYAGFYDRYNLYEEKAFGLPSGDDRYEFSALPTKFAATIFVNFTNGKALQPISGDVRLQVYDGQTPAQVIQQKKDDLVSFDIGYYFLSVLLVGVVWFFLAYSRLDIQ